MLRVRGDSMIEAHIADGDFVVIRPQDTARDGDIVVAQVEENAVTLKRFFREKDRVRLQPANPNYPPQFYPIGPDPGKADRRHPASRLTRVLHRVVHIGRQSVTRIGPAAAFVDPSSPSRRPSDNHPAPTGVRRVVIDRLPPQSIEAEQSVLGSILIDRDAIIEVADFLKPEDFYRQAHGRIYAVMLDLSERREPVDIVTVAEALERAGTLRARRPRVPWDAVEPDADSRPRGPVRSDRRAQGRAPKPDRGGRQDRRDRLRGPAGGPGGDRPGRGGTVRRQPAPGRRRLLAPSEPAPRCVRPARLPPRAPRRDQRHPDRVPGPRLTDHRAPEERPHHPRRPPIRRQDKLRAEHRRARGRRDRQSVGFFSLEMSKEQLVLRLLSRSPTSTSQRLRTRLPRGARLRSHRAGHERPVGGADLYRRHAQHHHHGAADEGPPAPGGEPAWTS